MNGKAIAGSPRLHAEANKSEESPDWIPHRDLLNQVARANHVFPAQRFAGRGIVICAGGEKYLPSAYVCVRMLRHLGCRLPVQLWHLGDAEMPANFRRVFEKIDGVSLIDAHKQRETKPCRILNGWELKCYAIIHSPFHEVLLLDADNVPVVDPEYLFDLEPYRETGAIFWPDLGRLPPEHAIWRICQIPYRDEPEFESGQIVVDKSRCWAALQVAMHLNEWSDFYYRFVHGDKETFHLAWRKLDQPYAMAPPLIEKNWTALYQHDFTGRRLFQHRSHCKWSLNADNLRVDDFHHHDQCISFLGELRAGLSESSRIRDKNTSLHETGCHSSPTKLILTNGQSPGDILMLTAAVRDLHQTYPGAFQTDVRTSAPQMWENNPYVTPLREDDAGVRTLECHYPLIHRSHEGNYHFAYGFVDYLNQQLGLEIRQSARKGDIHLSDTEKSWTSQVEEITGASVPFWIVAGGGKYDYTIKWWDSRRYQDVVDHFRGKLQFVQVGEKHHYHPTLRHVLDLRGKTDIRQLIRLVYHAQGVLCGVTLLMHLAAAVETTDGTDRPCVVVAGGREPPQWEAYPSHEFIDTIGKLPCCSPQACWRSRTVPLGDGDEKDSPDSLCKDVVGTLPRCMDMIQADDVIERIQRYIDRDAAQVLTLREQELTREAVLGQFFRSAAFA